MKYLLLLFFFLLLSAGSVAQNAYWVHLDKTLIERVFKLDKNDPKKVERFFAKKDRGRVKENLGFGWSFCESGAPGGYVTITGTFLYYHDSVVSYTITPRLPSEKELVEKYKDWYRQEFKVDSTGVLPLTFNSEKPFMPLSAYQGSLSAQTVPRKILEYASPSSGMTYGYRGGFSNALLRNRKAFLQLENSLSNEQVVFLMYALNPASRFTAIEYYLKHKEQFSNQAETDAWIETNYKEVPEMQTLSGCIGSPMSTRWLVQMHLFMEE